MEGQLAQRQEGQAFPVARNGGGKRGTTLPCGRPVGRGGPGRTKCTLVRGRFIGLGLRTGGGCFVSEAGCLSRSSDLLFTPTPSFPGLLLSGVHPLSLWGSPPLRRRPLPSGPWPQCPAFTTQCAVHADLFHAGL